MKKDKEKNLSSEEMEDDIGLFEDFEEPTEVKKTSGKDESITDDLPEKNIPPDNLLDDEATLPVNEKELAELTSARAKPKPSEQKSSALPDEILKMSSDIPVQLVAVIGKTTISVKELMNYQMGQVIDLGRPPGETVDLVASGKLFARGELVDIDGKLGVRIVKLTR